jgi:hypothetical protein
MNTTCTYFAVVSGTFEKVARPVFEVLKGDIGFEERVDR